MPAEPEMGVWRWKASWRGAPVGPPGVQAAGEACRRTASANIVARYLLHQQLPTNDAFWARIMCCLFVYLSCSSRSSKCDAASMQRRSRRESRTPCSGVALPTQRLYNSVVLDIIYSYTFGAHSLKLSYNSHRNWIAMEEYVIVIVGYAV